MRYLPRGTAAGDRRADFLTVGTYLGDHAYEDLKKVSTGPPVHSNLLDDGALLVAPEQLPRASTSRTRTGGSRSKCTTRPPDGPNLALNGLIAQSGKAAGSTVPI